MPPLKNIPHIDKGSTSTQSSAIPERKRLNGKSFFWYTESETLRSFSIRWVASSTLAFVSFLFTPGLTIISLYAALMIALVVGLTNAFLPFILSAASFTRSLTTVAAASLVVTVFLLYMMTRQKIGVSGDFSAVVIASITISIITWFITLALKRSSNETS